MKVDTLFWLMIPLLVGIVAAAIRTRMPKKGTGRKSLVVGIIIAATIIAVYYGVRYVIFPPIV